MSDLDTKALDQLREQYSERYDEGRSACRDDQCRDDTVLLGEVQRRVRASLEAAAHPRTWRPEESLRNAAFWLGYADEMTP